MKKIALLVFVFILIFVSCNKEPLVLTDISVADGEFLITPNQFVDRWNQYIKDYKPASDIEKKTVKSAKLPFVEHNKETEFFSENMTVTYKTNRETGNLTELNLFLDEESASDEEFIVFDFLCEKIAKMFISDSTLNLKEKLGVYELDIGFGVNDNEISFVHSPEGETHLIEIYPTKPR